MSSVVVSRNVVHSARMMNGTRVFDSTSATVSMHMDWPCALVTQRLLLRAQRAIASRVAMTSDFENFAIGIAHISSSIGDDVALPLVVGVLEPGGGEARRSDGEL